MNYPALKDYFLISLLLLSACQFPGDESGNSYFENRQHPHEISSNTAHTLKGRTDGKGFDLVFVADGFTEKEMPQFFRAVENYRSFSEQYEPVFNLQKNAWNIHLIQIPSKDSGVDEPKSGTFKDTVFDSSFECEWVDRIICVDQEKVLDVVSDHFPQYDAILVLANSSRSGGASLGNNIITSAMSKNLNQTIIHELGHALANLGDEYTYGGVDLPTREPSNPNLTLNEFAYNVKWGHWLDLNLGQASIGVFEGGHYLEHGVWRPTNNSVMRTLGQPFHAVNLEAWSLALYRHTGTYLNSLPDTGALLQNDDGQTFEIDLTLGEEAQNIEWRIDDKFITPQAMNRLFVPAQTQDYIVQASISDSSLVIRKDNNKFSQDTLTWWVSVQ